MMFRNCPACLDQRVAAIRCGLPAEVRCRFTPNSGSAYYLSHPAGLWITAIGPLRARMAGARAQ